MKRKERKMYERIGHDFEYNYRMHKIISEMLARGRDVGHYHDLAENLIKVNRFGGYHSLWTGMVCPGRA